MSQEKKSYKIKEGITKYDLLNAGFYEGGWIGTIECPKVQYIRNLKGDIELNIEICTKEPIEFDQDENVLILDEAFCQPYYPFYTRTSDKKILDIIKIYNQVMDELVEKDILVSENLEENKVLQRTK